MASGFEMCVAITRLHDTHRCDTLVLLNGTRMWGVVERTGRAQLQVTV